MASGNRFNYEELFAKNAPISTRGANRNAKYDFAVAYPDPESLPLDGLVEALKTALEREGKNLAYYPVATGLPSLRQLVAEKLARDRNMTVTADDVILTSGSGEALAMLIQALTDPGDVVLTEDFVYLGTLRQLRLFGADVQGVKSDKDGSRELPPGWSSDARGHQGIQLGMGEVVWSTAICPAVCPVLVTVLFPVRSYGHDLAVVVTESLLHEPADFPRIPRYRSEPISELSSEFFESE